MTSCRTARFCRQQRQDKLALLGSEGEKYSCRTTKYNLITNGNVDSIKWSRCGCRYLYGTICTCVHPRAPSLNRSTSSSSGLRVYLAAALGSSRCVHNGSNVLVF